jgi:hypothetical protein
LKLRGPCRFRSWIETTRNTSTGIKAPDLKNDHRIPITIENEFSPLRFVSDSRLIGYSREKGGRIRFRLLDEGGTRTLSGPSFPWGNSLECSAAGASRPCLAAERPNPPSTFDPIYEGGKQQKTNLYWISSEATEAVFCCSIEGEHLFGFAVSPDGKSIVTITGGIDYAGDPSEGRATGKGGEPQIRCFLNVIDRQTGLVLRRFPLLFPEEAPKWIRPLLSPFLPIPVLSHDLENEHTQIAQYVAVSPDNSKVVVAYGFVAHNDGIACFGVYSMVDGHRMATTHADTFHAGVFRGALGDNINADGAQLMGPMMFTPNSQKLIATCGRKKKQPQKAQKLFWGLLGLFLLTYSRKELHAKK